LAQGKEEGIQLNQKREFDLFLPSSVFTAASPMQREISQCPFFPNIIVGHNLKGVESRIGSGHGSDIFAGQNRFPETILADSYPEKR
jgi:hypothetical protein